MRDVKRIGPLLNLISDIWKANPDLRLCQLIGNCFGPRDLYYIEDDKLEEALKGVYGEEIKSNTKSKKTKKT